MVAPSMLFMFFLILNSNRNNTLSLGFRVGKFGDGGPLDSDCGLYFSIF